MMGTRLYFRSSINYRKYNQNVIYTVRTRVSDKINMNLNRWLLFRSYSTFPSTKHWNISVRNKHAINVTIKMLDEI